MASTSSRPLQFAILGLGPAGTSMVPVVAADPRFALRAVCDASGPTLAACPADPQVRRVTHLAELCADPELEVVYVATPTWLHEEHALELMRAGKHVIVEKPISVTREQALALVEEATRQGLQLVVGHSQSFEPTHQVMRAVIDSGYLGPLRAVNAWAYTDWMYRPRDSAEFDRSRGGGVVFRQAAHQIDILRFLATGHPSSVVAAIGDWDRSRPGDGSYSAFISFAQGITASLFYSGYDHFATTELTFGYGPSGVPVQPSWGAARKRVQAMDSATEAQGKNAAATGWRSGALAAPGKLAAFGLLIASCERGDLRVGEAGVAVYDDFGKWEIPVDTLPSGRAAVLDEMVRALAGDAQVHDGRWGLANLEVCLAMLESASLNGPVQLSCVASPTLPAPGAEATQHVLRCVEQRKAQARLAPP